jgi:hypothetical protein
MERKMMKKISISGKGFCFIMLDLAQGKKFPNNTKKVITVNPN